MITLAEWTAFAKVAVERVGKTLPPDGDWAPVALAWAGDGPVVVSLGVPPEEYGTALRQIGAEHSPDLIAMVMSSWRATFQQSPETASIETAERLYASGWSASKDPDRVEILVLAVADRAEEVWWMAPILRSEARVALGEWERMVVLGGRAPGSLVTAIRREVC